MAFDDQSQFAVVTTTFVTNTINHFEPGSFFAIRCRSYNEVTVDVPAGATLTISTASTGPTTRAQRTGLQYRPDVGTPPLLVCTFDDSIRSVSGLGLTCEGPRRFKLSVWRSGEEDSDDDDDACDVNHTIIVDVLGTVSSAATPSTSSSSTTADTRVLINNNDTVVEADDYCESTTTPSTSPSAKLSASSVLTSSNTSVVDRFSDADEAIMNPSLREGLSSSTNNNNKDSDHDSGEMTECLVNLFRQGKSAEHLRLLLARSEPSADNASASAIVADTARVVNDEATPEEDFTFGANRPSLTKIDAPNASIPVDSERTNVEEVYNERKAAIDPSELSPETEGPSSNKRKFDSVKEAVTDFWLDRFPRAHH